ncbi:unannotated protein [freshwater metagenome]|uniref:Unannotated protein n=1 Tax=freshwater metagenome TaxID=449393 RepID=A0A6J7FAF3_9ZZZZ
MIEGLARSKALAEVGRLAAQFLIGQRRKIFFERIDRTRQALELAKGAALAHAQDKIKN